MNSCVNGFYIIRETIKPLRDLNLQPDFVEVDSQLAEVFSFFTGSLHTFWGSLQFLSGS